MNFYEVHAISPEKGAFIGACNFKGCLYILLTRALYRMLPDGTLDCLTVNVPENAIAITGFCDILYVFTPTGIYEAGERRA